MKNKLLRKLLAISLASSMLFGTGFASTGQLIGNNISVNAAETENETESETFTCGEYEYSVRVNNTVMITAYNGNDSDVVIPSKLDGKSVTALGIELFYNNNNITSVVIPDTVTLIRNSAFKNCQNLKDITMSKKLVKIEGSAFYHCVKLKNIELPSTLKNIGNRAFWNCYRLEEITIPASVTNLDPTAFGACYGLKNVNLPESLKEEATILRIPEGTTEINYGDYKGYGLVEKVIMPDSVTEINDWAFSDCIRLKEINLPDGLTSIGVCAFSNCDGLTSITIPDSVTELDIYAFHGCDNLTDIKMSDSLAAKVKIVEIPKGTTKIKDYEYQSCPLIEKAVIPDTVTEIGEYAFSWCDNLKSVNIPANVKSIGDNAFAYCKNLTLYGEAGSYAQAYAKQNYISFVDVTQYKYFEYSENADNTLTITGYTGNSQTLDIPESINGKKVTAIGNNAFAQNNNLKTVIIPESVSKIGALAFYGCQNLEEAYIPQSVTSIGDDAFYKCSKVTFFCTNGSYAVAYAKENNIKYVYTNEYEYYEILISGTVGAEIKKYNGDGGDIVIPKVIDGYTVTGIEHETFLEQNNITGVIIPDTVTYIGYSAFYGCKNLKSAVLPSSLSKIGNMTFGYCDSLENVTISDGIQEIDSFVFTNCTSLKSIVIPDSVTYVHPQAFWGCDNLNNVQIADRSKLTLLDIPEGTENIREYGYQGSRFIENVTIPDTVTEIGRMAFTFCDNLKSVNIPASVTSIGDNAFKYCENLTLYGEAGSYAETYANENNIPFIATGGKVVDVTGIKLSQTSLLLETGKSGTLEATISPSDATYKAVTWTTSNEAVATVSENGVVKAVSAGTATITATTVNGLKATCKVTVKNPVIEVTGIKLDKTSLSLSTTNDTTAQLKATVEPSNATNKTVTWSSSNSSIAKVSSDGTVTAVSAGTATITAKSNNGKTAKCTVTVQKGDIPVTGISLDKTSVTLEEKQSEVLKVTFTPSDATNKKLSWKTSNAKVAKVSADGTVTAVSAGTATITASSNNGKTATCTVTVTEPVVFKWGSDNWSFDNSDDYFSDYNVSRSVMKKMQNDFGMSSYEIELLKEEIRKDNERGWNGSCFGMTVSEIMAKHGDLKLSNYDCNDVVNENSNTYYVTSVINFIQELQGLDTYAQHIRQIPYMSGNYNQYDFIDMLESVLSNEAQLLKLSYGIKYLNRNTGEYGTKGYHAVLAYGVEQCSYYSPITKKTYDRKILIADPNSLSGNALDDNACLYYRSSDHSWIIPYWNVDYSNGYTRLCYWNSNSNISTNTGFIRNIMKYNSLVDCVDLMSDYKVDHYIAGLEIYNISQNQTYVQQVEETGNPALDHYGESGSGIARYDIEMDDSYNIRENDEFYALWNPTANYELSYKQLSDYYSKMDYEGLVYIVDATNSTYTLFKPSGYINLKGSDADFKISIITDDDKCVTDWFSVGVSGSGADNLTYKKTKEGYVLSSDELKNITVSARNDNVDISKTFSTDYNCVLIYEIDENTIGLKVDTDNNGTFETDITGQLPLKNDSTLSSENITLGESITASAKASGGTGEYLYQVVYKKTSDTKWTTAQGYKANPTVTFKPASATTYDVCVKVKDSYGTELKKFFTVKVNNSALSNLSEISSDSIQLGNTVTVNARAAGGTSPYKYAVYYKASSASKWSTKQDFSTNSSVAVKFTGTGTKDICVKVKDNTGTVSKKYFTVKVSDGITNNSTVSAASITLGNTVTVKGAATGGTPPYNYAVYYKASSASKWSTKQDFSTNSSVSIKFTGTGTKDICVKVKDNTGTVSKKYFTVNVVK